MAGILFENLPGTRLYRPVAPAANEALLFLMTGPPNRIPAETKLSLEETWSGKIAGYYLFLKKLPGDNVKFEEEAAKALKVTASPPEHSSFAWVSWDSQTVTVVAAIDIQPGEARPTVKTDSVISLPGFPPIGVGAGSPVRGAKDDDGSLNGFILTYPPQPPHDGQPASGPPWGGGMTIPMSGMFAGCFRFEALLNAGSPSENPVTKQIAEVSFDPVRPLDPQRTRVSFTGILLNFGQLPSGAFYLEPVDARSAAH